MAARETTQGAVGELPDLERLLTGQGIGACCAAVYDHPAVRWLLGGELHPGGEALTRRAFELLGLGPEDRLLDVASGRGTSALLAAREIGCRAAGVDRGEAVRAANTAAETEGLSSRVGFIEADAACLPFPDASFDAALSECSLCLLDDKATALREVHRVLRPGGRVAIGDVVAMHARLPVLLRGTLATLACVGSALEPGEHEALLQRAGFEVLSVEDHSPAAAAMARRITDRLRGARILGLEGAVPLEGGLAAAVEMARQAEAALGDGRLGYVLVLARRR